MSIFGNRKFVTAVELFGSPIVDLVERSTLDFAGLLRMEKLPSTEELEMLDKVFRIKVLRLLSRDYDVEALALEMDALRRLVPYHRYDELNNCRNEVDGTLWCWSARWRALADLLRMAINLLTYQSKVDVLKISVCQNLLDLIKEAPGSSESNLLAKLQIQEIYFKRYLGLLEANGLIRLSVHGDKKFAYPVDKA